jgi:hypothetical protein
MGAGFPAPHPRRVALIYAYRPSLPGGFGFKGRQTEKPDSPHPLYPNAQSCASEKWEKIHKHHMSVPWRYASSTRNG